jgi:predicted amidohydrolase
MRVAAIQLEAEVGDIAANLEMCERLGDAAGRDGAELIALPEFFSTGIGFIPELVEASVGIDGEATNLLTSLAKQHGALVGGSFLCRDEDGEVRNAFLLASPDGSLAGRHDKDLPTMWENAFYVGGNDDGVLPVRSDLVVGVALCWEMMRTQTVRRLRGRVDLVVGGSGWWSIPHSWGPSVLTRRLEARNETRAQTSVEVFSQFVGAPLVHAAHAGPLCCPTPWLPIAYSGHFEGPTLITSADGKLLAFRHWSEGEGIVVADVEPGKGRPAREAPNRFWLHRRGVVPSIFWNAHRAHGRRWYRRHVKRAVGAVAAVPRDSRHQPHLEKSEQPARSPASQRPG